MPFVNEIRVGRLSTVEIEPITVQFDDLDDAAANVLVSARRFNTANSADAGTSITAKVTISGNEVSIADIWLDSETEAAGDYRIQIVVCDPGSTEKYEANVYVEVV